MEIADQARMARQMPGVQPGPGTKEILFEEITELLERRDAVLVAHYYVDGDI